ncbi:MAG TPA: M3 family oligoendopeptidase [Ruminiclostridium sp.]|nr:M3 family oligoendopeptidase [Ruminiclostridium sp.]
MKFSQMTYTRTDLKDFSKEWCQLITDFKKSKSAQQQLNLHNKFNDLMKRYSTMRSLAYIRHTLNTEDGTWSAEQDYYDENGPHFEKLLIDYYKELVSSKFRSELEKELSPLVFEKIELALKGFDERMIPYMQEEGKLTTAYAKLLAAAEFQFDGKTLNLPMLTFYMEHPDREIRRAAFQKRTEFFVAHAKELDELYDKLVKVRTAMAREIGMNNYIPLGYIIMERNDYDRDMVANFRNQVKEYLVPLATKLHDKKRRFLGLERLSFIDEPVYFKEGNPAPVGTPEQIFENGKRMYSELSPQTKEFFNFMLEGELFDVLSKKGKTGGGYCDFLPFYKSPFVFANFNGTSGDIDVLTHECGHALESYLTRDMKVYEQTRIGMETAEIHSMSMEFFTAPWMHLFFQEKTPQYLYMHLLSTLIFIPYGCMVDEFQHIVFENPDLTPDERKKVWRELEGQYKPHLNYEGDPFFGRGGTWQRQTHIYERPFYYIDYCLAQTCALQYKIKMEADFKPAWESYLNLSRRGGTMKFTELIRESGLESPFEEGCLKHMVKAVEELIETYENKLPEEYRKALEQ